LTEVEKHKLESDAIRFKMEAGDALEARDRSERQLKTVTDECSNLKIKLNSERARHAETAEQSRALTHLAAQMRSKNEKLEKVNDKQSTEIKMLRKRATMAEEDLVTQTSRVDALTKICQALEAQVRDLTLKADPKSGPSIDIADKWRQEAYKFLVQMSYTESKLSVENRKLAAELNKKKSPNRSRRSSPAPLPSFIHSKNKSF